MEVGSFYRTARSMALAIPRQIEAMIDVGSIRNARQEVRGADQRRELQDVIEQVQNTSGGMSPEEPG